MASALIVFGDEYLIRLPFSCFVCADEFKEGSAKGKADVLKTKHRSSQLLVSCLMLCWLPDGFRGFYAVLENILPGTSFFMGKSSREVTFQASYKLISPR